MKTLVRANDEGVSPVIATILMVAITVVLAAVLYVMVSGLISSPGQTPTAWGVSLGTSTDGTNWTVSFTSIPATTLQSSTFITVSSAGGAAIVSNIPLSQVSAAAGHTFQNMYYNNAASATLVGAGTTLLLKVSAYPAGSTIQIVSGTSVVYTHAL